MEMFVNGEWKESPQLIEVKNPFDQSVIDTVPAANNSDVEKAIAGAEEGAKIMAKIPAFDRAKILRKTADLMLEHADDFAKTISMEEGKILAEAQLEATRAAEVMQLSSEEAKRLCGEVLPMDAAPGAAGKMGFTLRVPCGLVAAITPFNFPLNLVCHKVGPALAGGNSVIIKPASDTPLSALKLVEVLLEAGAPPQAITCLTGAGSTVGSALSSDRRIRKISFTGSYEIGDKICRNAGMKRVTMELGSNSPLIIMEDANLQKVVEATAITGYANAGQVCISAQRVLAQDNIYDEFLDRLQKRVETISTGDQLNKNTGMGPMIREADAKRVSHWIKESISGGARLITGGERKGTMMEPSILAEVDPKMKISCDELFGPAVAVTAFNDINQAIAMANDTRFGLSAGIFTQDIDHALHFANKVEIGNININWGPQYRVDLMPYGGLKDSGIGKEGPRYAIKEMTEVKMVMVHLGP